MSDEEITNDKYTPNYKRKCEVCGHKPTVEGV